MAQIPERNCAICALPFGLIPIGNEGENYGA